MRLFCSCRLLDDMRVVTAGLSVCPLFQAAIKEGLMALIEPIVMESDARSLYPLVAYAFCTYVDLFSKCSTLQSPGRDGEPGCAISPSRSLMCRRSTYSSLFLTNILSLSFASFAALEPFQESPQPPDFAGYMTKLSGIRCQSNHFTTLLY